MLKGRDLMPRIIGEDKTGNPVYDPKSTKPSIPKPPAVPYTTGVGAYKTPAQPKTPTAPPTPKPKSPNFSQTTLDTQKKLNAENKDKPGYVPLAEDGIMGPKTMNALNASQFAPLPKASTPAAPTASKPVAPVQAGTPNPAPTSAPAPTTINNDAAYADLNEKLNRLISSMNQPAEVERPDLSPMIKDRFNNVKTGLLAKIEAARNKALASYGGLSDLAGQRASSDLETNNADLAASLRRIFEGSEAAGAYRGGMTVQGQIDANTTAQNNANAIRQTKTNTLNDINRGMENVNLDAEQQRIAAEADTGAQLSQALVDAEKYGADYDLQRAGLDLQNRQFDFSKGIQEGQLTGSYNGQNTLSKQQFDAEQSWNEWNKQWSIENEAWQRNPENPQVQAQILQNKAMLLNNQMAEFELQNYPEEQKLKIQEYKKRIDQIGATPTLSQYDIDLKNAELDRIKTETANLKSGLTASGGTPSGSQPSQTEVSNYYTSSALGELQKLPDYKSKKAWLDQHAAEIIENAGTSAYSFLLDQLYN